MQESWTDKSQRKPITNVSACSRVQMALLCQFIKPHYNKTPTINRLAFRYYLISGRISFGKAQEVVQLFTLYAVQHL